jgi:hypothetical protein
MDADHTAPRHWQLTVLLPEGERLPIAAGDDLFELCSIAEDLSYQGYRVSIASAHNAPMIVAG